MKLPSSVRLSSEDSSYPIYEISHVLCTARVALHGAHVMEWKPAGAEEVLYLSPDAIFKEGKAIRGGIPLCWPWFNAHPSDPSQPSHGVARSTFWVLEAASEDENGVLLRFGLDRSGWHARVAVRMGKSLEIALESLNPGSEPIHISGALHSYFRVGALDQVQLSGLEDAPYLDTSGDGKKVKRQQDGLVLFNGEVDSIYDSAGCVELIDEALGRTIVIEKTGSPSTVVWNPWVEKAAALGDLPDEGYRDFVCVEAAIANDKAVTVEPGGSYLLGTRISVKEGGRGVKAEKLKC